MNLQRLKELREKATAGPWDWIITRFHGVTEDKQYISIGSSVVRESIARMVGTEGVQYSDDAELIVSLVNAFPDLITYIESLEKKVEAGKELEKAIGNADISEYDHEAQWNNREYNAIKVDEALATYCKQVGYELGKQAVENQKETLRALADYDKQVE